MKSPEKSYEKRKKRYERLENKHKKSANFISNLRLIVFILGFGGSIVLYLFGESYLSLSLFLIFIISFVWLVKIHEKVITSKKYCSFLYQINDDALKRLSGDWKSFNDTGKEFMDENHPYSGDLDIFGPGSLFQLANTSKTYLGRKKFMELLSSPSREINEIYKRQEAVDELADKLSFRQRFLSEALYVSGKVQNPEELFNWAKEVNYFYTKPSVILVLRLLPLITISLILAYSIFHIIPYYFPLLLGAIQALLLIPKMDERGHILDTVYEYKENINTYGKMFRTINRVKFSSNYLKELQSNLVDTKGNTTLSHIKGLTRVTEKTSGRKNSFYFFFNILTLWDYQCMISLEKWKTNSGIYLKGWIETIGEFEALSSLAVIRFDNPSWAFPKFSEDTPFLSAKEMAHPLLSKNRVSNNLRMEKPTNILLITGSNMSGKSTLLRTAGINLVLAYSGAPVCAESFTSSIMDIYTCMRVSDNLEKNISSFYAELLRIKMIVKAADEGRRIFFLLDEIFKGTNSMDRHTGAKVLIKKLNREGAMGLVSTHDLELGELEYESKNIRNYHFREFYKDNEIHFDYKLRLGISTTRNALYLIKMIGIEIDE